ncbi:hypothetical protein [Rhodoferax sp.]|nr:hypothetical protein [Rhodoferax sp.]
MQQRQTADYQMSFTLEKLGMAYRKAKVDLYYSTDVSTVSNRDGFTG